MSFIGGHKQENYVCTSCRKVKRAPYSEPPACQCGRQMSLARGKVPKARDARAWSHLEDRIHEHSKMMSRFNWRRAVALSNADKAKH